jgi:hypothetical protein
VVDHMADLESARLLATRDSVAYHLVPGIGDNLCLVAVSGQGTDLVSTGTCAPRSAIVGNGLYFADGPVDGLVLVAMLVPDGTMSVETAEGSVPVVNNLALFTAGSGGQVTLQGRSFGDLVITLVGREVPQGIDAGQPQPLK